MRRTRARQSTGISIYNFEHYTHPPPKKSGAGTGKGNESGAGATSAGPKLQKRVIFKLPRNKPFVKDGVRPKPVSPWSYRKLDGGSGSGVERNANTAEQQKTGDKASKVVKDTKTPSSGTGEVCNVL